MGRRTQWGAGHRTEAPGAQRISCGEQGWAWRRDSLRQGSSPNAWEPREQAHIPLLSHPQKILIGPKGHLISQIAEEASRDLMDIFLCEVQLRLSVKLLD